jgi:VWFA-related protein
MLVNKSILLRMVCALAFLTLLFGLTQPALAQSKVILQLHDIKVQPSQVSASYDVSVYFSLLDSARNPIKDAGAADFSVYEDNQPVKIAKLGAENESINVAILLDTSGSMAGDKINAARSAASRFIEGLQSNDQVAVLTFDKTTTHRIDFTLDHTAAKQQVALVDVTPGGYTCLYDAAYETIQLAKALPSSRRAIILLTDGKDEASNGTACSLHTLDEVISLASAGNTPIPIYTIGLGEAMDTQTLESLADGTNGRYQSSPKPTQLEALFGLLLDELRSAYGLHYTSTATPGEHTLTLHVKYQSAEDEVGSRMEMPVLPYHLNITSPVDAAVVTGKTSLSVEISGQGADIQKVLFLANNVTIGSDTTPPYEWDWNPSGLNEGPVFLEAVAQAPGGAELARSGITVTYKPVPVSPTLASTPTSGSQGVKLSIITIILAAVVGLVLLGIVAIVLLVVGKRRKHEKGRAEAWQEKVQGLGVAPAVSTEDRTMDSFTPAGDALGVLVVLQSDDPAMLNQRIEIVNPVTHLGRKADNDIIFAKDSPVSRHHAVIEVRDGQVFLGEVVAADDHTGQPKRPAYGTFVNGLQVQEPVLLRDGDEIMLGKRLRIHFEAVYIAPAGDDRTLDQVDANTDDKTIAASAGDKAEALSTDDKTVIANVGDKEENLGPDDKTVIANAGDKVEPLGPDDKTMIAGVDDKVETLGPDDKTITPGDMPK